jgi:hypothetical protein
MTCSHLQLKHFQKLPHLGVVPVCAASRPFNRNPAAVVDTFRGDELEFRPNLIENGDMSINLSLTTGP